MHYYIWALDTCNDHKIKWELAPKPLWLVFRSSHQTKASSKKLIHISIFKDLMVILASTL